MSQLFNKNNIAGVGPADIVANKACLSKRGFTLLELLVVVLIMGILAAVALPQYQKAVLKSRYITMQNIMFSIKHAAERTYLAKGSYPSSWDDMDVTIPAEFSGNLKAQEIVENDKISIDLYRGSEKNIIGYIPKNADASIALCLWLEHSAYPNRQECWAHTGSKIANALCQDFGGVKLGQAGGFNTYTLPWP